MCESCQSGRARRNVDSSTPGHGSMRAMRRHFDFLDPGERDRLFLRAPEPFDTDADPARVGVALGATLYTPATRPSLGRDIARSAERGVTSVVVCLEDAVSDHELAGAERNAVRQLQELHRSGVAVPMVFVRVRRHDQIAMVVDGLGRHADVLAGFVAPKFTEDTGDAFLTATVAASERLGRRLLLMPVLESPELGHAETRVGGLLSRPAARGQVPRAHPGRARRRDRPVQRVRPAARPRIHGVGRSRGGRHAGSGRQRLRPRRLAVRDRRAGLGVLPEQRADLPSAAAHDALRRRRGACPARRAAGRPTWTA